jgi:hypothetical protein
MNLIYNLINFLLVILDFKFDRCFFSFNLFSLQFKKKKKMTLGCQAAKISTGYACIIIESIISGKVAKKGNFCDTNQKLTY